MASSWFIGKNNPDRSMRPEDWAPPQAKRVELPEYSGPIEYDGTWYITNNLPYAERVGLDPRWAKGGAGGTDWFTRIVNQQPRDFNKRAEKYLRRVR
jgi:hypothetical protein